MCWTVRARRHRCLDEMPRTIRTPRASVGRPRDESKRAAMLAAAKRLFLAHGFAAVSMEGIAAEARVAKVTVYKHFGDKETVLEAVVREESARIEQVVLASRNRGAPVGETLEAFGVALMQLIMSPELLGFDAILRAEAARNPELVRRFYDAGPGYVLAQLARTIAEADVAGALRVDDPMLAAEDLAGLWQGMHAMRIGLGLVEAPGPAALRARVRGGVQRFLRIYATDVEPTVVTSPH